jgi:hypothetical protein
LGIGVAFIRSFDGRFAHLVTPRFSEELNHGFPGSTDGRRFIRVIREIRGPPGFSSGLLMKSGSRETTAWLEPLPLRAGSPLPMFQYKRFEPPLLLWSSVRNEN